jgi:hypothetical protein
MRLMDAARRTSLALLILLIVMSFNLTPARAQIKPGAVPDVAVIVFSGTQSYDMAGIAYNSEVPKAVALEDLKTLAKAAGWKVSSVSVTSESARDGGPKQTAISFQVDNNAVEWAAGILQVEPFAIAFKRFNLIKVNYALQGTLPFRSLRDYTDRNVDIKFNEYRGTFTYLIQVKNHDYDKLGLPLIVAQPKPGEPGKTTTGPTQGGSGTMMWLAFVIAIAAGAGAYFVASRKSKGADKPTDGTT